MFRQPAIDDTFGPAEFNNGDGRSIFASEIDQPFATERFRAAPSALAPPPPPARDRRRRVASAIDSLATDI